MNVVTAAMREQRRARRESERAQRGAPPRVRFGPRPGVLIRAGWSPSPVVQPPASAGPRLLGAAGAGVLIAGRAQVVVAERAVDTDVLPLPPVTIGPLPSNPTPGLLLGIASFTASTTAPERAAPLTADPVVAEAPAASGTVTAGPTPAVPVESEAPVVAAAIALTGAPPSAAPATPPPAAPAAPASEPAAASVATLPPGPWTDAAPAEPPPATTKPAAPRPAAPAPSAVPTPPSGHSSPRAPLPSDALAHALGLSPANNPAPTAAPAPPTRRSRRSRPVARYEDPRPRRRLLVAAVAVVVLAGAGTAIGVAVSGGSDGGVGGTSTSTAPDPATRAAASWLSGNVTTERRIVTTDAGLASDLNGAGVPVDTVVGADESRVGVIVVASGASDPAPTVVSAGANSLVLVALFTGGSDRITVSQVVQGSAEQVRGELDQGASTAASACKGLSANAAVTIGAAAAPVFEAGDLDLRASTLLAVIAQAQPVEVVAAPQDPAELAAARPVRTLVIKVQDDAEVRQAAASARAPYSADVNAPTASLDAPPGSLVLSWPTDASATLPLG